MARKQKMSVVMKVADNRYLNAFVGDPQRDLRKRCGGLNVVHSYAHQLRARSRKLYHLTRCRGGIGGIRVGHRLDDNRMLSANGYAADKCRSRFSAGRERHCSIL
jgi:hypothetical protein